jgi:hypothetical protein
MASPLKRTIEKQMIRGMYPKYFNLDMKYIKLRTIY